MKEALELIEEKLAELRLKEEYGSIEEKAEHSGLIARYEMSIDRLKLCEKYEITGGSIVKKLPESGDVHFCYKLVHENESSNPCDWEEFLFDKRELVLEGGDLVVKR